MSAGTRTRAATAASPSTLIPHRSSAWLRKCPACCAPPLRGRACRLILQDRGTLPREAASSRDARRIEQAGRRIAAAPDTPLTLTSLANEARISRYRFLRAFRQSVGVTPYQYLLRMRLQVATARLRRASDSITSIAYGAGFNDLSTFNRRFRRIMGMTPREWRSRR